MYFFSDNLDLVLSPPFFVKKEQFFKNLLKILRLCVCLGVMCGGLESGANNNSYIYRKLFKY